MTDSIYVTPNTGMSSTNSLTKRVYTPKDGEALISYLFLNGVKAELIGSLSRGKDSLHDIDVLVDPAYCAKMHELLSPAREVIPTDWGGLYFRESPFGDVDVFFEHPEHGDLIEH